MLFFAAFLFRFLMFCRSVSQGSLCNSLLIIEGNLVMGTDGEDLCYDYDLLRRHVVHGFMAFTALYPSFRHPMMTNAHVHAGDPAFVCK